MNISKLGYELYRIDWMRRISADRQMDAIKDYYEGLVDETEYSFDDYIYEFGYDGELYVCYEEFVNAEYLDEYYMKELFNNDKLFNAYKRDLDENFYTD